MELLNTHVDILSGSDTLIDNKKGVSRFKHTTPSALFLVWTPLAVLLVWAVITKGVAAYLADDRPEMALQLQPTNTTALLNRAEVQLKRDQGQLDSSAASNMDPGAVIQARSWAELALRNDPLNARALRILGQLSEGHADKKRTAAFMQAAARRSLHESAAVYWMMRKSFQDQDYSAAIAYADTLLRTRNDTMQHVIPVLGKIAEIDEVSSELTEILVDNPPWLPSFFASLPRHVSDLRTPVNLLLTLKNRQVPVPSRVLAKCLHFLVWNGLHNLAYYTWLEFLPPEQLKALGHLFNGSFETPLSGTPFDWDFPESAGATIEVAPNSDQDGDRALFIKFGPGRVNFRGVRQFIILPPGNYVFRGKQQADLSSRMGLRWQVACEDKDSPKNPIGESELVNGRDVLWKDFSFSFTVPETGCSAQFLRLVSEARSASEKFISGSIWYDNLHIERQPPLPQT